MFARHHRWLGSGATAGSGRRLAGSLLHRAGSVRLHAGFFPGFCTARESTLSDLTPPWHPQPSDLVNCATSRDLGHNLGVEPLHDHRIPINDIDAGVARKGRTLISPSPSASPIGSHCMHACCRAPPTTTILRFPGEEDGLLRHRIYAVLHAFHRTDRLWKPHYMPRSATRLLEWRSIIRISH
ncbi:hypothetical protein COCNU_scaffold003533G000030 [Cocos nucifera]|nr:hypothetical protein [Cocos nucifera]